jgi:hypothetical protein
MPVLDVHDIIVSITIIPGINNNKQQKGYLFFIKIKAGEVLFPFKKLGLQC